MKILANKKGIIIFYLALIAITYVCTWRFERLDEKQNGYTDQIVMNEK